VIRNKKNILSSSSSQLRRQASSFYFDFIADILPVDFLNVASFFTRFKSTGSEAGLFFLYWYICNHFSIAKRARAQRALA